MRLVRRLKGWQFASRFEFTLNLLIVRARSLWLDLVPDPLGGRGIFTGGQKHRGKKPDLPVKGASRWGIRGWREKTPER